MKNIRNLVYKELKLLIHPVTIIYFFVSAGMALIPDYPRFIGPFYILVGIMITMSTEAQYRDKEFCGILPVTKAETVKARMIIVILMEMITILASVPTAIAAAALYSDIAEPSMIAPNFIVIAEVLLGYAAANTIMVSANYRKRFKVIVPSIIGMLVYFMLGGFCELFVTALPGMEFMRTNTAADLLRQIPYLIVSLLIYLLAGYLTCRSAIASYEKAEI